MVFSFVIFGQTLMLNTYQVRVMDWAGAVVNVFAGTGKANDSLIGLTCSRHINQIGTHQLIFQGNLTLFESWKLDYQIEVLRRTVNGWATVYHGFHRTGVFQTNSDGLEEFISYGHDLKGLLARACVPTDTVSVKSVKNGPADDVMKAYVNENIGVLAVALRARLGVIVQADASAAPTWSGSQARQSLFDAVHEVALASGVDFDIVSTATNVFEFQTYYPQIGVDRTIGNAGLLQPVIFSLERNNMATPVLSVNHGSEINAVYVLGQGEADLRDVVEVIDYLAISQSPWNRVEAVRQASNIALGNFYELELVGFNELVVNRALTTISFTAIQTPQCTYGVHYSEGDTVTGLYHTAINKRVVGVLFSVSGDRPQESIRLELSDVN
jgi:hypothetical protein